MNEKALLIKLIRECFYYSEPGYYDIDTLDWSFNECYVMHRENPELHRLLMEFYYNNNREIEKKD